MVSFQGSPLSTPEGIVGTFRQCAAYQKDKNLDSFVSIVVLDGNSNPTKNRGWTQVFKG
jgi:hypothetical protein